MRRGGGGAAAGAALNRDPSGRGRPGEGEWEYTPTSLALANAKNAVLRNEVNAFLKEEGVAISITPGYNGDGGTIFSTYGGSEIPRIQFRLRSSPLRQSSTTASSASCSTASRPS